jgi:hypothetical protein
VSDIVNINLLIKPLQIIGLPGDLMNLIRAWLEDRSYYGSLDGVNLVLYDLLLGTVQGSILGPVLYAIFLSPLFDLDILDAFADDMFIQKSNYNLQLLISHMEKSLESITKWIKHSGLKVNKSKTDSCLFYKE